MLNESKEARDIANIVIRELKKHGVKAILDKVDKAASQAGKCLNRIVAMANRSDIDYFVSIHFNSSSNKSAHGTEVYTYKGRQFTDALEVASFISKEGFRNRGVKDGTGLYVVRRTNAKSMLIEVCFVDGQDAATYKKQKEDVGKAIARALWNNVQKVEEDKKNKEEGKKDMLNKLVVYKGDVDANIAVYSWEKHNCMMVKDSVYEKIKSTIEVKELIRVGGLEADTNRYATAKNAIDKNIYRRRIKMDTKEFIQLCKDIIVDYANNHLDPTDKKKINTDDVYVVWYSKTLQNSKALLSTTLPDGMYYELTLNGSMAEVYMDAYKKWENRKIDL